uniref:PDEase domain-containing protein n=1 Tax=Macrostomum lignano TaxID=282301 RepID=A0A1I8IXH9_9PLAT
LLLRHHFIIPVCRRSAASLAASQAAALQASAARSIAMASSASASILSARSTAARARLQSLSLLLRLHLLRGDRSRRFPWLLQPGLQPLRPAHRLHRPLEGLLLAVSCSATSAAIPAAMRSRSADSPSARLPANETASCRLCRLPLIWAPLIPSDLAATDTVFDLAATDTVFDLAATDTVFDLPPLIPISAKAEDLNSEARKPGRQADAEPSRFEFKASAKLTYIMSEAEEAAVEAWLDSHPDFFEDYFHRRGSRGLVDGWLRRRLAATSSAALGTVQLAPRSLSCSVGSGRLLGQRSHRIRKASSELHADEGSIGRTSPAMPRRHALPALTEEAATAREMMLSSLLMELDSGRLRRRIVRACRLLLAADRCALFLAEPGGWLRLTADTVAAEAAPTEPEVRVPPGVGIVGNAAATGQTLRLEEAAKDPRFNAAVDELPSCATVRALAAPLKHPDGGSIGLLLATSGGAARPPSPTLTRRCCWTSWRITFEHMENLELLVNNILQYMRLITRCTWCQILLIDDPSSAEGSFDRVFELLADEADGTDKSAGGGSSEIAQSVLSSGEPLIVPRAESDSRLTPPSGPASGRCSACPAVGPLLLMNPADGRAFSESDANLAEAFALFCGLGIHSVRQRSSPRRRRSGSRGGAGGAGLPRAGRAGGGSEAGPQPGAVRPVFRHRPAGVRRVQRPEGDTLLCSIKLFQEAGLLAALQLDYRALCLWLLSVHKNYRPLLHHNWRHAFGVAHCACRLA